MYIQFNLIPLVQHVTTSTRKKFFKCTYVHLHLFYLKLSIFIGFNEYID